MLYLDNNREPCLEVRVVISRVISPLVWVISLVILLATPLRTTHEPPSRLENVGSLQKMRHAQSLHLH